MTSTEPRRGRLPARRCAAPRASLIAVLSVACAALAAACGSSSSGASSARSPERGSGPVDVVYAASLVNLMEHDIGPAFSTATGYQFSGFAAGSSELANEIKGEVRRADVFISAAPAVNGSLQGAANGDWVSWYSSFATAGLVIGYNPHSRFASQLRSRPWYRVVTEPGFLLGRTDQALDPKGALTVKALDEAAAIYHDPALGQVAKTTNGLFPEETLVGRLQAGQLDAGFFYTNEAREAGIPVVHLGAVKLSATYTVTVVNRAPHAAAARAFVAYLLGPDGRAALQRHGLSLIDPPKLSGQPGAVPPALRSAAGSP